MTIAVMQAIRTVRPSRERGFGLAGLMKRLQQLAPRHSAKPHWSHVPDRMWRRHSAMLTFRYEAQSGGE